MRITELLTWIFTVHTRTKFRSQVPSGNVEALKPVYDQIVESARLP
jgi:hypothetical protein